MRKWSFKYVRWRVYTAYPEGFFYIIRHPFIFLKDSWSFLNWCQKVDEELYKEEC